MRSSRLSARRTAAMVIAVSTLALVLSGCIAFPSDPAQPMGVRLHGDGTVDLVSCEPLSGITKIEGSTYLRTGWNGTIDDKSEVDLTVETPQVESLSMGYVKPDHCLAGEKY